MDGGDQSLDEALSAASDSEETTEQIKAPVVLSGIRDEILPEKENS